MNRTHLVGSAALADAGAAGAPRGYPSGPLALSDGTPCSGSPRTTRRTAVPRHHPAALRGHPPRSPRDLRQLLTDTPGALWKRETIDRFRVREGTERSRPRGRGDRPDERRSSRVGAGDRRRGRRGTRRRRWASTAAPCRRRARSAPRTVLTVVPPVRSRWGRRGSAGRRRFSTRRIRRPDTLRAGTSRGHDHRRGDDHVYPRDEAGLRPRCPCRPPERVVVLEATAVVYRMRPAG